MRSFPKFLAAVIARACWAMEFPMTTVFDRPFESLVDSVSKLPSIKLSVFGVAASTRFMERVAAASRTVPVTELVSDLFTIGLYSPRLLDESTISSV